jgi:phosphoserine aminotransferase
MCVLVFQKIYLIEAKLRNGLHYLLSSTVLLGCLVIAALAGFRASIYNAMEVEGVKALVQCIGTFAERL